MPSSPLILPPADDRLTAIRATLLHATKDIRLEEVPDPGIVLPGDALVRVSASCVCGSDLWPYRGINEVTEPRRIGHEFVGIVEEIGSEVSTLGTGDFVIASFTYSDNTCPHCRAGVRTACDHGGGYGSTDAQGHPVDGGQIFGKTLNITGGIDPGQVFDLTLPLDEVAEAYAAMDERRAIKVMLQP